MSPIVVIVHDLDSFRSGIGPSEAQPPLIVNPDATLNVGGYAYIANYVVPALKAKGVSDETIRKITVDNPRRVLTFVAPQPPAK